MLKDPHFGVHPQFLYLYLTFSLFLLPGDDDFDPRDGTLAQYWTKIPCHPRLIFWLLAKFPTKHSGVVALPRGKKDVGS